MKILREYIREMLTEDLIKRINVNQTSIYVLGEGRVRDISFCTLMENRSRGLISEDESLYLWERSVSYEFDLLLAEGVFDHIRDAYETVKGGAIRLKDKISGAAKQAMERANDFLLKITLQAMSLAKSSVEGIVRAAGRLSSAVDRFRDNHPILYRIIKIIVMMLIIWGIMSLFSGEAQAAVKYPGGGQMTENQYNILRGALGEYGGADVEKVINSGKAIKILDNAYKSKDLIPLEQLGEMNQAAISKIADLVGQAKGGDETAYQLLMRWKQVGQNLVVR